jgi:predicted nucleic acid-binding protein
MNRIVVADAGPLIALARIEHLSLLFALYGSVVVPEAVLAELCVESDRPGAREILRLAGETPRQDE